MVQLVSPVRLMNPSGPAGGAGVAVDTLSLNHFDGTDGATTTADEVAGKTWVFAGTGVELDTAQKRFGSASISLPGAPDTRAYVSGFASPHAGNWTWECFVRFSNETSGLTVQARDGLDLIDAFNLQLNASDGAMTGQVFSDAGLGLTDSLDTVVLVAVDTWYHIALVKDGSSAYLFFNGDKVDTDTIDAGSQNDALNVQLNETTQGGNNVWVDEPRFSKTARYTGATYTVPAAAFTVD